MKFLDKIKDLFTDEEEEIEEREVEVEENENHQLPTFMRNKIEEEKREEEKKKEPVSAPPILTSDREIVRTRTQNNFSFPIDMEEPAVTLKEPYSSQNVLVKEREKSVSELYSKKEEPKPRKFKPTPVISPVYGVLDKNYTKDEVKVQDTNAYEIQRPSRKVDFETVRNKAFGNLTDDIKNNLCENCELYQEVKITKNADRLAKQNTDNLLSDMVDNDVSLGTAEENYFDFGVSYEPTKQTKKDEDVTIMHADKIEINNNVENEVKIINHNGEDSRAEKIEVKDIKEEPKILLESEPDGSDDILSELAHDEQNINSILKDEKEEPPKEENDIFNLIDSMYDEEEAK